MHALSRNGKSALAIVKKYHPNVTHVEDADEDLEIHVTANDCKGAKAKSASNCAMARACRRTFDGAIISVSSAYIIKGKKAMRFKVPARIAREIISFDRGHRFMPGEYKLNAPTGTNRLGSINKNHGQSGERSGKEVRQRRHFTQGIREL
jgi:hypothetical protein